MLYDNNTKQIILHYTNIFILKFNFGKFIFDK